MSATPFKLLGAPGSPYSRKMRALLRYRRLPFRWIVRGSTEDVDTPAVPVDLIPVLVLPGSDGAPDEAMIDSSFQIRRLEMTSRQRSVVPPDPAIAFLDRLVEDYADEWLTKAMFHYRWFFAQDAEHASRVLPLDRFPDLAADAHARLAAAFAERQVARLAVVGSSPETAPVIESSYRRLLAALDALILERPFVFGHRPAAADFALHGQLTQLAQFDPTSVAVTTEVAPRVVAWVNRVEDLSDLEPGHDGWISRPEVLTPALTALLAEIGRTYAPFLLANAAALEAGASEVRCAIDGVAYLQKPFAYQRKCLQWLREAICSLGDADRRWVDGVLAPSGCGALFASGAPA